MQKIIGKMLSFVNVINDKIDQIAIFADEVKKSEWRGSRAFRLQWKCQRDLAGDHVRSLPLPVFIHSQPCTDDIGTLRLPVAPIHCKEPSPAHEG